MTAPAATPRTLATREEWLAERKKGIGASDAAALLGLSPWKSPLQLYCEKLSLIPPDERETEAMEWGLLLEGPIGDRYAAKAKRTVTRPAPFTIYAVEAPAFLAATFDAFTEEAGDPGVVEVKNVGWQKAEEWAEEPPLYYQIQLQWQLRVSGFRWGSLAALVGGQKFVYFDLPRNDRFIALLEERGAAFWARVEKQEPPTPVAMDAGLMGLLYPTQEPGARVLLPPEAAAWDAQRLRADVLIKEGKALKDEAEALLKGAIGPHEIGVLPDGAAYSWKSVERKGYEVKPTTYRELRRKAGKP